MANSFPSFGIWLIVWRWGLEAHGTAIGLVLVSKLPAGYLDDPPGGPGASVDWERSEKVFDLCLDTVMFIESGRSKTQLGSTVLTEEMEEGWAETGLEGVK
jgi:hypothetical protein